MHALFWLILTIIDMMVFLLIAQVVFSWLVAFNIINTHNRFVALIWDFLHRVTEPVLGPIRRILPNMGGLDISLLILLLGLFFIQQLIRYDIAPRMSGF